jgi:hypothetical protein
MAERAGPGKLNRPAATGPGKPPGPAEVPQRVIVRRIRPPLPPPFVTRAATPARLGRE